MKIQFFGGARSVTGSQYLLSVNGSKILLECGLFQGRGTRHVREEPQLRVRSRGYRCSSPLARAHRSRGEHPQPLQERVREEDIYHFGDGGCQILLRDSAYLNEKDVEWVNKIRAAKHEPPLSRSTRSTTPRNLSGISWAFSTTSLSRGTGGVTATFQDAGHILGSACVLLEIEENDRHLRVGFSGDLGRKDMPIIRDPGFSRISMCSSSRARTATGITRTRPARSRSSRTSSIARSSGRAR